MIDYNIQIDGAPAPETALAKDLRLPESEYIMD
jgi:hypothetical protein